MKAGFLTYGCKVNQYETQAMREALCEAGYAPAGDGEAPDVFIINSCTVTAESDRKTRQAVRRYRRLYPAAAIVLTGCMPQAFPDESGALAGADIVLGNRDHTKLIGAIEAHRATGARIIDVTAHERFEPFGGGAVSGFFERTRAYQKIQDGCDRYCAYCIIPKARGPVRSKPLGEIKAELSKLSQKFKEIVLVGINLTAYGSDTGSNLCEAVEAAAALPGVKRVRLGSLEPDRLPPETLERLSRCEKLCPHFHLSLQSGCDETLGRMNRHYTAAEFAALCADIRGRFKDAAVTTDIMVGFPGETEDEFERSLAFVREAGFARAHVFAYSRRPGTVAARLPGQVPNRVKQARSRKMIEAANESAAAFLEKMKGTAVSVLMETGDGGYTPNYTYVRIRNGAAKAGDIVTVNITGVESADAVGEIAE